MHLREVVEADLEVFFQQEQDPEALRRSRFAPRERGAFMAHWTTRVLGDPAVFVRTIAVDGEPAGNIVAWWEQQRRFLGYWLGRRYWGRGIGSEALRLFLRLERTRPIYADPVAGNVASVRLVEKHGFEPVETARHGSDEHIVLALGARTASAQQLEE